MRSIEVDVHDARGSIRARQPSARMPSEVLAGTLVVALVLIGACGVEVSSSLRFERDAIVAGQWWRLLTCHLVHPDPVHLVMNGFALLAWGYVLQCRTSLVEFSSTVLLSAAFIGISVLLWNPGVEWMAGASALVHALVAASSVKLAANGRAIGWVVVLLLGAKITGEQYWGASTWIESLLSYPVIYDAHAFGAVAGLLAGLGWQLLRTLRRPARAGQAEV